MNSQLRPRTFWLALAWLLILVSLAALWVFLSRLADTRQIQAVTFDDVVDGITFQVTKVPWTTPIGGTRAIEISGCRLRLDNVQARFSGSAPLETTLAADAAIRPVPGAVIVLENMNTTNLQVQSASDARVTLSSAWQVTDLALTWSFDRPVDVLLFSEEGRAVVRVSDDVVWENVKPPVNATAVELTANAVRPFRIACDVVAGAQPPTLAFVAVDQDMAREIRPSLEIVDPEMDAPRGDVVIGTSAKGLGGGDILRATGRFTLERIRWSPGVPPLSVRIRGRSSDVRMGDEQLAPSRLAVVAGDPQWTAFAAVLVVVFGSLVSKLFELALPTKE